jgi:hypothetical protein
MIPVTTDHSQLMGPTLKAMGIKTVDKSKHWSHSIRRGIVRDLNPKLRTEVKVGDVVVFRGASGFTMDGDLLDDGLDEYGKGEGHRWLKESELLAIDEALTEALCAPEKELSHV